MLGSPVGDAVAVSALVPLTYLYGAYVKERRGAGEEVGPVDSFIEEHPNFSASMAVGLARMGLALKGKGLLDRALIKVLGRI